MKKIERKMLTVREVAQKIGVQGSNVRKWVREGRFRGARKEETALGSYWLIPESSIDEFVRRGVGRPRKAKLEEIPKAPRRKSKG